MRILIKSVLVQDSLSDFYNQKVDLLADGGCWVQIENDIQAEVDLVISLPDLKWFPSCFDLRVHHTLPGGEFKEDWTTLSAAAKKGGVLDLFLLPTGNPVPQQPESFAYIIGKSADNGVSFHPMAPLTLDNKGENFSDLFDLNRAGARWFAHGFSSIQDVDLMGKCMQYLQSLPVTIVSRPDTEALSKYGQVHEGLQSTLLGLKGIPILSETMHIKRDLDLLSYILQSSFGQTNENFRLHFSCLSSSESVDLIRKAKKMGLPVSCDVAVHQLIFTEESISDFDTNKKVFPPFRTQEDINALWDGLKDGTIDAVVSDHQPHESEMKDVEFDQAAFGTIGLETLFLAFSKFAQLHHVSKFDRYISSNPAQLANKNLPKLAIGQEVKGFLSQQVSSYRYSVDQIESRSKNSVFIGESFEEKIVFVILNDQIVLQA